MSDSLGCELPDQERDVVEHLLDQALRYTSCLGDSKVAQHDPELVRFQLDVDALQTQLRSQSFHSHLHVILSVNASVVHIQQHPKDADMVRQMLVVDLLLHVQSAVLEDDLVLVEAICASHWQNSC